MEIALSQTVDTLLRNTDINLVELEVAEFSLLCLNFLKNSLISADRIEGSYTTSSSGPSCPFVTQL